MPESVVEAACMGVRCSDRYPDTGYTELKEAIAQAEGVRTDDIICGNGAAELIYSLVLAADPKKALVPAPSFFEYGQALRAKGCELVFHYLKEKDGFAIGEEFLTVITGDLDMIFLCNPNNPTGRLTDRKLMKKIIQRCTEENILLVVDECFMDFADDPQEYSVKSMYGEADRLFILKAFTKIYAMPGLRLGYGLCGDKELLRKIREAAQPWSVSIPAQKAGIAALKETGYLKESLKILKKEKAFLLKGLEEMGIRVYGSGANYIFFHAGTGLYEKCLKKGFLIRDCSNYEGLEDGYYRIAVRTRKENEALLAALREVL